MIINPPDRCQICDADIKDEIVDGATNFGPWAWMCPKCHKETGHGFGTGRGQLFRKVDGKWVKING